jgi:hypothetical protein
LSAILKKNLKNEIIKTNLINSSINFLINKLGTNAGTVVSISTLIGLGFGAGIYYNNLERNIEKLEIAKKNFDEVQELKTKMQILEIDNKNLTNTLTKYEKERE